MTLGELSEKLTVDELSGWIAYFRIEEKRRKRP